MSDPAISPAQLIDLLAPVLGRERAEQCVSVARASTGLDRKTDWTLDDATRVLDVIARTSGDAGLAAAQAQARLTLRRRTPAAKRPTYTRRDLVVMLARTLGEEKATEVVADAARILGLGHDGLAPQDALRIFERLAAADGMVGVAARFAKTRVLLGS